MNEVKHNIKRLLTGDRLKKLIILAGGAGILLIFLSGFAGWGQSKSQETVGFSVEKYCSKTEEELASLISKIQGVGKTRVLLTMENSVESVYLENGSTKTKEIEPRIRGVLVLCEGGDDPVAVGKVSEAVTKALDISSAKVCIEKLSE